MATSLFAKAKEKAPSQVVKGKGDKLIVPVSMGNKIKELTDKRNDLKSIEAEIVMLEGEILPVARTEFMNLVKKLKARPESFILQSAGANMMVIAQDRYVKFSETLEQTLIENKLGDIIEEETEFSFDPVLLEKHEKAISKAISGIKTMTDEEKVNLINAKVVKKVKKGTINQIATFDNPELVFQLIQPVFQLKNSQ